MKEAPLIVRVVLAENWLQALRDLWAETFGRIAGRADMMMVHIKWPARRLLAAHLQNNASRKATMKNSRPLGLASHLGRTRPLTLRPPGPCLERWPRPSRPTPPCLRTGFARTVAGCRYFISNPNDEIIVQDVIAAARVSGGRTSKSNTGPIL